jgi:2-aminoadipate transaminase
MNKIYRRKVETMLEALEAHMPQGSSWTRPEGGVSLWVTLPKGIDAAELLIHLRERGVIFVPGRYFYFQQPQPNTLRLSFAALDEKEITRGVQLLGDELKTEFRKRQRGGRLDSPARVALI